MLPFCLPCAHAHTGTHTQQHAHTRCVCVACTRAIPPSLLCTRVCTNTHAHNSAHSHACVRAKLSGLNAATLEFLLEGALASSQAHEGGIRRTHGHWDLHLVVHIHQAAKHLRARRVCAVCVGCEAFVHALPSGNQTPRHLGVHAHQAAKQACKRVVSEATAPEVCVCISPPKSHSLCCMLPNPAAPPACSPDFIPPPTPTPKPCMPPPPPTSFSYTLRPGPATAPRYHADKPQSHESPTYTRLLPQNGRHTHAHTHTHTHVHTHTRLLQLNQQAHVLPAMRTRAVTPPGHLE